MCGESSRLAKGMMAAQISFSCRYQWRIIRAGFSRNPRLPVRPMPGRAENPHKKSGPRSRISEITAQPRRLGDVYKPAPREGIHSMFVRILLAIAVIAVTGFGLAATAKPAPMRLDSRFAPSQSGADVNAHPDIPDKKDFHDFLKRDLNSYFRELRNKTVRTEYELLRDEPTIAGIAYPKYYAWVKVFDGDILIEEGAVRLAAVEKKQFNVTDYLSKEDIKRVPPTVARTFPKVLIQTITERANK
jgi:hypothetical protein